MRWFSKNDFSEGIRTGAMFVIAVSMAHIAGSLRVSVPIRSERVVPVVMSSDDYVQTAYNPFQQVALFGRKCKQCQNQNQEQNQVVTPVQNSSSSSSSSSTSSSTSSAINQLNENEDLLQSRIDGLQLLINQIQNTPGPAGKDGIAGSPGPAGPAGLPGAAGKDGLPGKNGTNGIAGLPGAIGQNGKDGLPGKDGVNGKDGKDFDPATIDFEAFAANLPPFLVKVVDPQGKFNTGPFPVHLGEQLNLVLEPIGPSGGVSGGVGVQVESPKGGT